MMDLVFRDLWVETNQIAGFHDGITLKISSEFLDNHAIRLHEELHGRIFEETPDGQLHLFLLHLIQKTLDPSIRKRLEQINTKLFNETRLPHERVATFLGIKALPSIPDIQQAMAALPKQYIDYFSFLDCLCQRIPTTFVSFAVGWAIACAAFSSPRFESLGDLDDLLSGRFFNTPGPNARLNQLNRAISALGAEEFSIFIRAKIGDIVAANQLSPFDYDSEEEWKARSTHTDARKLDRLLIEYLERHFCELLGTERRARIKIPSCFAALEGSIRSRKFTHEFPIENGEEKLSPEAVKFYSRELDFQRISRPGFVKAIVPDSDEDFEFIYNTLLKASFDYLDVAIIAQREPTLRFVIRITGGEINREEFDFGLPIVGEPDACNMALGAIMTACDDNTRGTPKLTISLTQELALEDFENNIYWGIEHIRIKYPLIFGRHQDASPPPETAGLTPYLYARGVWSGMLATTPGSLASWAVTLQTNPNEQGTDFVVSVLYPEHSDHFPYLAVMSNWCHSRYLVLARGPIQEGQLKILPTSELPPEIAKAVTALWFAYTTV